MRPCTALQRSGATCRHRILRSYSSATQPLQHKHDATKEQAPESFQIDQDGKTVKTAVGDLPLSPVMDPGFWEARGRYKQKKPKPGRSRSVFEREFQKNPFAQALSTPVRIDNVTKLRMPSYFLQDFNIVSHPETGRPWWVSKSLALNRPPAEDSTGDNEDGYTTAIEKDGGCLNTPSADAAKDADIESIDSTAAQNAVISSGESSSTATPSTSLGPSAYVLAHRDVIASLHPTKTIKKRSRRRSTGNSDYRGILFSLSTSKFKPIGAEAVWREDMERFILQQIREQIFEDLLYLSGLCETQNRYYIVKCFGWDDIKFKHKGAVLWFGHDKEEVKPGPFSTFDVNSETSKTTLVVHNMPRLLGQELAEKVKTQAAALQDGSIFMLAGRRTTDLQLRLWKLQGYIYDFQGHAWL
ncbi:hypothetical protein BJ166DRAFT_76210 [Pestalotiopsis sp. NC0098]|nr:hypothetical protein BJ166DRAFT_76210 [Pestalotiopsis sp. NC0098]